MVDDYEMVRRGLRRILELEQDIEVVGETGNAKEALLQVLHLSPDVVLMDIKMPEGNGLEVAKQLKSERFAGKVIFVTMYQDYLSQAIEAGAAGYLVKDAKAHELVSAIRCVHEGGFVFGASVMNTAQGQETAFRYLAGQDIGTLQEPPGISVETGTEPPISSPRVALATTAGDIDLVVSPPAEPIKLLRLHRWLLEVAHAEIRETSVSWEQDTVVKVTISRPIPLFQMLTELPDVAEVTEEPYTADRGTIPRTVGRPEQFAIGVGHTMPKRLRLVLKRT